MPAAFHSSSSILLIAPDPELLKILTRFIPHSDADVCASFEEALQLVPLATYQLLICPYRLALRNAYALLSLNRRHNPCAPFVVTMSGREFSCVQHAIDRGVLGVLDAAHTIEDALRTLGPLLSLYQLRFSIARRERWVADYRDRLRKNPVHNESEFLSQSIQENRIMCLQALVAIEGSMQALRAYAGDLAYEATERMGWLPGKAGKIEGPRTLTPVPRYADT